jgi:lipopolysaccharide biosynthesis regulator YciM
MCFCELHRSLQTKIPYMSELSGNDGFYFNQKLLSSLNRMLSKNMAEYHDSSVFESFINFLSDNGRINEALRVAKLAKEIHSNSSEILLKLAGLHVLNHDLNQAQTILESIQLKDEQTNEYFLVKGKIESHKGNSIEAINNFKKALKNNLIPEEVYPYLATELRHVGKELESKYFLKKQLRIVPEDDYSITLLFDILENNRELDEGIEFFDFLVKKEPFQALIWFYLGVLYKQKNNYGKALRAFEYCYFIDDNFIGAYHELSTLHYRNKEYKSSIEYLEKVIQIEEPYALTFARLSKLHRLVGDQAKSKYYAEKACLEDPQLDLGWRELAYYYFRKQDNKAFLKNIQQAYELDNDSFTNAVLLGKAYQNNKLWQEALLIFQKLIHNKGLEAHLIKNLLICHLNLGNYENGMEISSKASVFSNDVDFLYFRAYFSYKTNDIHSAISIFNDAYSQDENRKKKFDDLMEDFLSEPYIKFITA